MFDIGFWEIFLILILALLVIGPERLPGAARTAGLWVGRARRYVEGVKNDVEQEFDVSEFKRMVHNQTIQISELKQQLNKNVSLNDEAESEKSVPQYDISDETADKSDIDNNINTKSDNEESGK